MGVAQAKSVMWMFAVLLVLAAGMFALQAVLDREHPRRAWKTVFLMVFVVSA